MQGKRERQTDRQLLIVENKLMVTRRVWQGGFLKQMMGIKEDTYHDEHRVMYKITASLYHTWETNITLC